MRRLTLSTPTAVNTQLSVVPGEVRTPSMMTKLQRLDQRSLRIVAWNIRSHKQRRHVLETLLQTNNIVALQETKIKEKPS